MLSLIVTVFDKLINAINYRGDIRGIGSLLPKTSVPRGLCKTMSSKGRSSIRFKEAELNVPLSLEECCWQGNKGSKSSVNTAGLPE